MTTIRRVAVLVSVAGLASLGVTACGDDDDGGDALTQEEFVDQGNQICSDGNDELDAAFEDLPDDAEPTPEQISEFADTFEENVGGQIDDIDELVPPDDIADEVDSILADARDDLDEFVTLMRDDPESAFTQEEDPFADVNERLNDIGLTECANSD